MSEKLIRQIEKVNSKETFVAFLQLLAQNLKENPQNWENKSLADYLDAAASWTEDMEGYYKNNNLPLPGEVSWKVFADVLMAASRYE